MSRGIYARLPDTGREALYEFAELNWRDPRDEAARLIMEGLRREGVLPAEQPDANRPSTSDRPAIEAA